MIINLPKQQAIQLLETRIEEVDKYDFEANAWRSKVKTDVGAIFNDGQKNLDVIYLSLISAQDKQKAKRMLEAFIVSINEHVPDRKAFIIDDNQEKIKLGVDLIKKSEEVVALKSQLYKLQVLVVQNEQKDSEIERLKNSIWQIENVNIPKLWRIFKSLKLSEQILIIGGILTLFGLGFTVGSFFQKNHLWP